MDKWIAILENELSKSLPGPAAQQMMSPSLTRLPESNLPIRKGSVMILLYTKQKEIHTLFIKRAEYGGVHSGQISFPGGIYEPGDDSLTITALRETEEEIGIPRELMRTIGQLTVLHIPVSNVDVLPIVAVLKGQSLFIPNADEVEFIIEARLGELRNPLSRKKKMIAVGDFEIEAPYFDIRGYHIWGATAMILSEFLEIVERVYKVPEL